MLIRPIRWGVLVAGLAVLFLLDGLSISDAAGAPPAQPPLFDIGDTTAVQLTRGTSRWWRIRYAADAVHSHFRIETRGQSDTCMRLFRDLDAARADEPLLEDDDSGQGRNASITQAFGYAPPLYLELTLCGREQSGRVTLASERLFVEPDQCDTGDCIFATTLADEPSGRELLELLRGVRDLLSETPRGRQLADLYWDVSRNLLFELATEPALRRELRSGLVPFTPAVRGLLAPDAAGQIVLTPELLDRAEDLLGLVSGHLSPKLAERLDAEYRALELERHLGRSLDDIWRDLGLGELAVGGRELAVIVRFEREADPRLELRKGRVWTDDAVVRQLLEKQGVASLRPVFRDPDTAPELRSVYRLQVDSVQDAEHLLEALRDLPDVVYAELDGPVRIFSRDVYSRYQYGLQSPATNPGGVDAVSAWTATRGSRSVLVAVVDTGVDHHHADFGDRVLWRRGRDFADDDRVAMDDHGHGTHVAGIIAATVDNGYGGAGVAPNVTILPVRVLGADGQGSASSVAEGIVYAAQAGAQVINLSLGSDDYHQVIEEALEEARRLGALPIAATGNDEADELSYPARSRHALAVGATDVNGERADFSNYGDGLELSAPGVDVVSTWIGGTSCYASGTSMAAPHAAGVAALVLSRQPRLSDRNLAQILTSTARDRGPRGYDREYGWGIVHATEALGLSPTPTPPDPPAGAWLESDQMEGFDAKVRIGRRTRGQSVVPCVAESLCVAGALADRPEVFLKVIGPRPNGKLWVQVNRFTPSEVEVWLRQRATGTTRYYRLAPVAASATRVSGLQDREAFDPVALRSSSSAGTDFSEGTTLFAALDPATGAKTTPPAELPWITTRELPGYRFKARITAPGGAGVAGQGVSACVTETLCVSGARRDRPEVFVKLIGPRPNGYLWLQVARFTPSRVELWVEQRSMGTVESYRLEAVGAGESNVYGILDREAFRP